ncbi:hypothetical protein [Anaerolinea sp.]|uniref:hypothetical protein n=1 Tax=Anaerolinea sp. TaxID=1872519 RepID=UPI002ACE22AB|nr:hypothetical protein [Anaerolinea sp.]
MKPISFFRFSLLLIFSACVPLAQQPEFLPTVSNTSVYDNLPSESQIFASRMSQVPSQTHTIYPSQIPSKTHLVHPTQMPRMTPSSTLTPTPAEVFIRSMGGVCQLDKEKIFYVCKGTTFTLLGLPEEATCSMFYWSKKDIYDQPYTTLSCKSEIRPLSPATHIEVKDSEGNILTALNIYLSGLAAIPTSTLGSKGGGVEACHPGIWAYFIEGTPYPGTYPGEICQDTYIYDDCGTLLGIWSDCGGNGGG